VGVSGWWAAIEEREGIPGDQAGCGAGGRHLQAGALILEVVALERHSSSSPEGARGRRLVLLGENRTSRCCCLLGCRTGVQGWSLDAEFSNIRFSAKLQELMDIELVR
jgi:hypothetical protein